MIDSKREQGAVTDKTGFPVTAECQILRVRGEPVLRLALSIAAVAGPAILRSVCYHAGAHPIQFDVPVTRQDVATIRHQAGPKTAFPWCAATLVGGVDVLHVAVSQ